MKEVTIKAIYDDEEDFYDDTVDALIQLGFQDIEIHEEEKED